MQSEELRNRKLILDNYLSNPSISQRKLGKQLNLSKSTIQNVLAYYRKTLTIERKYGSGRKKGSQDTNLERKTLVVFNRNPNLSERAVAEKVGTSASTVHRTKCRAGLRSFKVRKVPDRNEEKNIVAKKRARKLYTEYLTKFKCCIMDDETYCVCDFNQIPSQEFYVARRLGETSARFKIRKATKFPKKYLVWQAICSCGQKSEEFVTPGTLNSEVYVTECLKKRLLPLIEAHTIPVMFWPDLATCHYGKKAKEFYEENGINIVQKEANPPNCPELRPIERYWAHIKRKLKGTKSTTTNVKDFQKKWKIQSNLLSDTYVQNLMSSVKSNVRKFWRGN